MARVGAYGRFEPAAGLVRRRVGTVAVQVRWLVDRPARRAFLVDAPGNCGKRAHRARHGVSIPASAVSRLRLWLPSQRAVGALLAAVLLLSPLPWSSAAGASVDRRAPGVERPTVHGPDEPGSPGPRGPKDREGHNSTSEESSFQIASTAGTPI